MLAQRQDVSPQSLAQRLTAKEESSWLETDGLQSPARRGDQTPNRADHWRYVPEDFIHNVRAAAAAVSGWWEAAVKRWTDGSDVPGRRGRRRDELQGEDQRDDGMLVGFRSRKRCWWRRKTAERDSGNIQNISKIQCFKHLPFKTIFIQNPESNICLKGHEKLHKNTL